MNGFTLYQANCYQNERNAYYPGEVEVGTLEQLLSVSEKDHTAGRFKNSHRAVDDFISSNCIMGDLDNGETDNEDFFKTVDDIAEAFPDVCFYYVFSRNHLKAKKRSDGTYLAPRYKVHVYFPLSREYADAVKYNKPEGGWVRLSLNADRKYFFVTISDSGIGIPKESIDHIFERFYRVDKSHSREIGGTGLGLAITRSAIVMHKGAIRVSSTPGEGTVFSIRVPLVYTP